MGDYGLMMDTLECSVNWDNFMNVYEVRAQGMQEPSEHHTYDAYVSFLSSGRQPILHFYRQNG